LIILKDGLRTSPTPAFQFVIGQAEGHYFEQREAAIAGGAKFVGWRRWLIGGGGQVALAFDFDAFLEVALVGENIFKPADVAKGERDFVGANDEMVQGRFGFHAGPASANKTGLNLANFEFT
jgi:hypothetical protein